MGKLSRSAQRQIAALVADYRRKSRPEAIGRLRQAVAAALAAVDDPTTRSRNAPGPYESLARPGVRWITVHIYWFGYSLDGAEGTILSVFWRQADIPSRIE